MTIYGNSVPALWLAAIDAWAAHARLTGAASTTLVTRCQHLRRDARTLGVPDPWEVTPEALLGWFARQPWATETRRGHRSSLRAFYGWAVEAGHVGSSPALALPRVAPAPPRPRPTPDGAYRVALAGATDRERLILRLAAEVGMRRAEVAQLHSRDLFEDLTGWSVIAHGKGGRDRALPLPTSLATAVRECGPGWLFPGNDGGHLSPRWVGKIVTRLLPEGYTMHTLRHRFATRAYDIDRDLLVVQQLLGHASPATTRRYVLVADERLRATVNAAA